MQYRRVPGKRKRRGIGNEDGSQKVFVQNPVF